jgi:hypothetical protein
MQYADAQRPPAKKLLRLTMGGFARKILKILQTRRNPFPTHMPLAHENADLHIMHFENLFR